MYPLESFDQVFAAVTDYCRQNLSDIAYSLWIRDIEPLGLEDSVAMLKVRTKFKKNIVEENISPC